MKTGNAKQATVLGVIAAGALYFLGSTIFSTFASGSTTGSGAQKPPADLGAPGETSSSHQMGSSDKESVKDINVQNSLPETEPGVVESASDEEQLPPRIRKTPFGKSKGNREDFALGSRARSRPPIQESDGGASDPLRDENVGPVSPFVGQGSGLPNAAEGSPEPKTKAEPPKTISIRFEGYVNAGNPVAIIRIGDSQYTADQGEGLPNGIRIIAITPEKLTLSIKGRQKSIWIGREVQL